MLEILKIILSSLPSETHVFMVILVSDFLFCLSPILLSHVLTHALYLTLDNILVYSQTQVLNTLPREPSKAFSFF